MTDTNSRARAEFDRSSRPGLRLSGEAVVTNILIVALLALVLVFSLKSPAFFSLRNLEIILSNSAAVGVVAAVMALLVIAGNVDLSVGSNIGLSAMVAALVATRTEAGPVVAMLAGIGTGGLVGLANGVLCAGLGFNPIIVTLGMLSLIRGSTLLINQTEVYGLGDAFFWLGNGGILGVPVLVWAVAISFALAAGFISLSVWGRYIYAIGINRQAAMLAALPVRSVLLSLHVAVGISAGVAGVLLAGRLDGASPGSLGLQLEMQVLTVVLLGGVAFAGGRGRMLGVLTAWLFLGVLQNGLTLLNVPPFVQLVASGLALVLAASIDALGAWYQRLLQFRVAARRQDRGLQIKPGSGRPDRQ
jgi:ribose/xylose/arabinose/galactoside ABC-type transport system permease subunit